MKKIVTVTLNPAFDFHYFMDSFEVGRENYVTRSLCYAAGKGVNVSRALHSLGIKSMSYVILGEQNGDEFEKMLRSDGMDFTPLYTEGSVRKNITLHHENGCETRVSLDDFWVGQDVLDELERRLKNAVNEQTLLSFSGRLPRGLSEENAVHLLEGLKSSGARLLLDCNSLSGETLKRINPWLIKPNEDEAAWLIGRKISDADDAANAAFELVKNGVAGEVLITLGGRGAAWSDGRKKAVISAPEIENPLSTVGAGDSTVAGYLAGITEGKEPDEVLALAIAFGTAACLTEGTAPPRKEDVERLLSQVKIQIKKT